MVSGLSPETGCRKVHSRVVKDTSSAISKSDLLARKSDLLVSILLLLVRKSDLLVSILLLLVRKSDLLASISLLLVRKSDLLASVSLLLVRKSDLLASVSLLLVRKAISSLPTNWRRFPTICPLSGGPSLAKREGPCPGHSKSNNFFENFHERCIFRPPLACLM